MGIGALGAMFALIAFLKADYQRLKIRLKYQFVYGLFFCKILLKFTCIKCNSNFDFYVIPAASCV